MPWRKNAREGGAIYTLSEDAANGATQRMAERHESGDLIAGLDLSEQDDRVAGVLMDLARAKTGPQWQRFVGALVGALHERDVRLIAMHCGRGHSRF